MQSAVAKSFARAKQHTDLPLIQKLGSRAPTALVKVAAVLVVGSMVCTSAEATGIGFSGTVINNTQSGFHLVNTRVQVFGSEAGVRVTAINAASEATRLNVRVTNSQNHEVAAALLGGNRVGPNSVADNLLVVSIDETPKQRFRVCVRQTRSSGGVVANKCFRLVVDRF